MESASRLFISGLFPDVTQNDLEKLLSKYGKVTSVEVKQRKMDDGTVHNTFAFLDIKTTSGRLAECFNQLSGINWKGSYINVQPAKESFLDRLKKERLQQQQQNSHQTEKSKIVPSSPQSNEIKDKKRKRENSHDAEAVNGDVKSNEVKDKKRKREKSHNNEAVNGDDYKTKSSHRRDSQSEVGETRLWYPHQDLWVSMKTKKKSSEESTDSLFPSNTNPKSTRKAELVFGKITAESEESTGWSSLKKIRKPPGHEQNPEVDDGEQEVDDDEQEVDKRFKIDKRFFEESSDTKRKVQFKDESSEHLEIKSKKIKLSENEAGLKDSLAKSGEAFTFSSLFGSPTDSRKTDSSYKFQNAPITPKVLEKFGDDWKPVEPELKPFSRRSDLVLPEDEAEKFFFTVADRRFTLATNFFQRQEETMERNRDDWQRRKGDLLLLCKRAQKKAIQYKVQQQANEAGAGLLRSGQKGRFSFRFNKVQMRRNEFLKIAYGRVKTTMNSKDIKKDNK